ncbi:hypothetical protein N0V84_012742 [Fusarium piperis]|uniref:Amidohydrolase-related domain-containing protein n=1 Tax=Fusarium piperis TaxID=1435070 RepID=A0A9W8T9Q5_9HYPO|nr:hypothetical protein N0V84_012742 [Fusarium piperis]
MSASGNPILLRNGLLLIHDSDGHVRPRRSDILIEGDRIAKIDDNIETSAEDVRVIDCEGKIVSPGFISTHHHVWQTQLKGKHANHNLIEYLAIAALCGEFYSVEDAFWGELSGALEAIDGGITTVLDHAHLSGHEDHPRAMIQALASSGLRAVFCYCVPRTVPSMNPVQFMDDYLSPTVLESWKSLRTLTGATNDRVQLGFSADNMYLPQEELKKLFHELRTAGAKIITSHGTSGIAFNNAPSVLQILEHHGLLGSDVLVSHATFPKETDARALKEHNVSISTTPNTELQMGTPPLALHPDFERNASLGLDCHSWGVSYMPDQMRMLLQHARNERAAELRDSGKWSRLTGFSAEQVFNLGTISGAKAMGMAGEVGQIASGAKADLVIFGTTSPTMLAAAEEDPVAAIVLHSSVRDVETVIVNGVVRKDGGELLPVAVAKGVLGPDDFGFEGTSLHWDAIAKAVLKSRHRIMEKFGGLDLPSVVKDLMAVAHMNVEALVEK